MGVEYFGGAAGLLNGLLVIRQRRAFATRRPRPSSLDLGDGKYLRLRPSRRLPQPTSVRLLQSGCGPSDGP